MADHQRPRVVVDVHDPRVAALDRLLNNLAKIPHLLANPTKEMALFGALSRQDKIISLQLGALLQLLTEIEVLDGRSLFLVDSLAGILLKTGRDLFRDHLLGWMAASSQALVEGGMDAAQADRLVHRLLINSDHRDELASRCGPLPNSRAIGRERIALDRKRKPILTTIGGGALEHLKGDRAHVERVLLGILGKTG